MEQDRTKFIGGSDVAAIMGLSHWSTPLRVWAEKTGKIPQRDLSDIEAVQIGTDLEEYVAHRFEKKTGFKLRRDTRDFKHPLYEYMVGHIDRWIVGEDALFEAKTTSAFMARKWEGQEMPREYILQVNWYLGLVGKSVGYVACLIGGQKFSWKQINFNPDLFDKEVGAALNFWENFVLKDIPPVAAAEDDEMLGELFPTASEETITFDGQAADEIDALLEERKGCIEVQKEAEARRDAIENTIKQKLGTAAEGYTGQFKFSWKNQKRTGPDSDKLREAGIYDEYAKTTEFRKFLARELRAK